MFVRYYFEESKLSDHQVEDLGRYMEELEAAGCKVGISEPPGTYLLIATEGRAFPTTTRRAPMPISRVLLTDVLVFEWEEQPIERTGDLVDDTMAELIDLGLPILKHGWPKLPQQGLYETPVSRGVVYLESFEEEASMRMVMRIEAVRHDEAQLLYRAIRFGSARPRSPWDDRCELEGRVILRLVEDANI